jgi:heme exporter protein CcmD
MNWSSLAEFIDMGGYGMYVWGSYLMVLGSLAWEVMLLVVRRRRAQETVRQHLLVYGETDDAAA